VDEPEVFVLAERALTDVVQRISDEQWAMEMPPGFAIRRSEHVPTLREVINYDAYDDAWVPDMLAGRTMEEAGADKYDGELLGDDPKGSFSEIVQQACAAATRVEDLGRIAHLSFGDYTIREYFWQINMFRGLRAHDLAKAIGLTPSLSEDLVQGIWDEVSPNAEEWRIIGVFPAAIPVSEDAPLLDRLLGLTGRDPYAD
jgi:hypothetical protein